MLDKFNILIDKLDTISIPFLKSKEVKFLVLFGFIYRFILVLFYTTVTKYPDSGGFWELADYLMNFDLSEYTGERSPGYPLLIFLGLGSNILTVIYQFILGVFTSVFWYKIALNLNFKKQNALWITLFLETFLHVFFYETAILMESFSLFFFGVIFYYLTDSYFEKKSLKIEIALSLLFGYLVLIKPFFAYIPFLIYAFSVFKNFSWRTIVNQKIVILVFPLIAYFGWSYVNKLNTGYFVSTSFLGLNISQNCVYFAEKGPKEYKWIMEPYVKAREARIVSGEDVAMSVWQAHYDELRNHYPYFPECSHHLGEYAKATIKSNLGDYFYQVITKSWFDFWKVRIYWRYDEFNFKYANILFLVIWKIQGFILYILKFSFLLLVPFYTFLFFKQRKITPEIVIVAVVFAGSVLQGLVTYGTNVKYSFPYEFLMVLTVFLFVKHFVKLPKDWNRFLQ
jgi:4-amino-4-deoxy-L-arabinose transferase-like glycosyltransferase